MRNQPSGIVTFIFSDIEGSTQRWERQPELMQRAFARQEAIMRAAMAAHNGYVYKMVGDAFQVAFANAPDAVAAAADAQRHLHQEPWGEIGPIKVRMGLHTGQTEERGDDYVGPLLNRVARLMSAGFGGQVLLTEATRSLISGNLPTGLSLRDMGERRLKDLIQPERVYQLLIDELPQDFPPLKTLDRRPNNLPAQVTNFIGREREMAEVKRLLSSTRLLTLTGAGGSGKTRLAVQVAADIVDEFEDGVFLVELASLGDPALVPHVIAQALAVRETAGSEVLDSVCAWLADKQLLMVLDNCEHLVEACALAVHRILRAAPNVCVVASSREPLRIEGEVTFRVPSLQTPEPKDVSTPASLLSFEAPRLFIDRASAAFPGFKVTVANATAIAQICRRLDGIPLAIELAAARVKALPPEKIAARLDDRFKLLVGGSRAALPRQQTLRAAIDWSYSLLSDLPPSERALLRRLAVFAGSWSLEIAEEVCADWDVLQLPAAAPAASIVPRDDVIDLMTSLADKSLLAVDMAGDDVRYRMLETIREYALQKLLESGEEVEARTRHAHYFHAVAQRVEQALIGAEQKSGLDVLQLEHDDLRFALEWLMATEPPKGLQLAGALGRFWDMRGYFFEGRAYLERTLGAASEADVADRAKAMRWQGLLTSRQGDYDAARQGLLQSLEMSRMLDDRAGMAEALTHLGSIANSQGDYDQARTFLNQSLELARLLHNDSGIAYAEATLGITAYALGDDALARKHFENSLAIRRRIGDQTGIGKLLNNLGSLENANREFQAARAHYEESIRIKRDLQDKLGLAYSLVGVGVSAAGQKDYSAARQFYEDSLPVARETGDKRILGHALEGLGIVARATGDPTRARDMLAESLAIRRAIGDKEGIGACLEEFGRLALDAGDGAKAARLLAATSAIRRATGFTLMPMEQTEFDDLVSRAWAQVGLSGFDAAWATGSSAPLDDVFLWL